MRKPKQPKHRETLITRQQIKAMLTTLDALFRRAKVKAGLKNTFVFHDSRHTAATWIAGRMKSGNIPAQQAFLDMCKIFGWSKLDRALTYYNPDPMDMVGWMG